MIEGAVSIAVGNHHVTEETKSSPKHQSTCVNVRLAEYSLCTVWTNQKLKCISLCWICYNLVIFVTGSGFREGIFGGEGGLLKNFWALEIISQHNFAQTRYILETSSMLWAQASLVLVSHPHSKQFSCILQHYLKKSSGLSYLYHGLMIPFKGEGLISQA